MKHETYSQNIYVYQLRFLTSEISPKKNFQALKSQLPIYKLHKLFAGVTDFPKVIGESYKLCKVVGKFYKFCEVADKFYKLRRVVRSFYKLCKRLISPKVIFTFDRLTFLENLYITITLLSTLYSQTCIRRPLLAPLKSGHLGQVVIL